MFFHYVDKHRLGIIFFGDGYLLQYVRFYIHSKGNIQNLGKHERSAQSAPCNHNAVGTCKFEHFKVVLSRSYIAVGDDGNVHRFFYLLAIEVICLACIIVRPQSAVHRYHIGAALLCRKSALYNGRRVKAYPEFTAYRLARFFCRPYYFLYKRRIFHKSAALAVGYDFGHGTAHVYINDVKRRYLFRLCHFKKNFGVVSEKLNGFRLFVRHSGKQKGGVFVFIHKPLCAHHFGIAKPCSVFIAQSP